MVSLRSFVEFYSCRLEILSAASYILSLIIHPASISSHLYSWDRFSTLHSDIGPALPTFSVVEVSLGRCIAGFERRRHLLLTLASLVLVEHLNVVKECI